VGRKAGIREDQLQDLARFEASPAFSPAEKLVLRLAAALTATPAALSDALFADLQREFTEPQLAELVSAIAWENNRARFNRAFAIGAEGFSEGAFCPLPETEPRP
jgi:alkylhydroperoxidase family enzyme